MDTLQNRLGLRETVMASTDGMTSRSLQFARALAIADNDAASVARRRERPWTAR